MYKLENYIPRKLTQLEIVTEILGLDTFTSEHIAKSLDLDKMQVIKTLADLKTRKYIKRISTASHPVIYAKTMIEEIANLPIRRSTKTKTNPTSKPLSKSNTIIFETLTEKISSLTSQLKELQEDNDRLMKDNFRLSERITDLTTRISACNAKQLGIS